MVKVLDITIVEGIGQGNMRRSRMPISLTHIGKSKMRFSVL